MKDRVCAVVVTYYPNQDVCRNLSVLRWQVEALVVVDNGSPADLLAQLAEAATRLDFHLIRNQQNLGIAAALNIGVRWARADDFDCVAFFDQDSTVTPGFIASLLRSYQNHPQRDRVAMVTSVQEERNLGRALPVSLLKDGGPLTAITSGSLMPLGIFDQCGYFEEDLVIDWVDFEYCLRLRRRGFLIAFCDQAVLWVNIGSSRQHRVLGGNVWVSNHSARRRYYMARNRLIVTARCARHYPLWALYSLRDFVMETVGIVLFERERRQKLANTVRGVRDAIRGRKGKVIELDDNTRYGVQGGV